MTTNQMVKLFAEILKDAPPPKLSVSELAQIRAICQLVRKAS